MDVDKQEDFLAEFKPREEFASELGVTGRTIQRYEHEPDGLPHMYLGGRDYVYVPGAKAWLARRVRSANPHRKARAA